MDDQASWYEDVSSRRDQAACNVQPPLAIRLLRALQSHPSIRRRFQKLLNRIPFNASKVQPLFIDWTLDDEVLEMIEQFEVSQLRFSHTDLEPEMIIDVGASCGLSSHTLLSQAPAAKLRAFEPRPDAVRRWLRRMQRLGDKAEIRQAAVGAIDGLATFHEAGVGSSTITARREGSSVPVVSIDQLISEAAAAGLILKIDVEGAERDLLPRWAPLLGKRSVLLVETHHPLSEVQSYSEPLRERGFRWSLLRLREMPQYGGPFADWLVLGPEIRFR